jgi:transposase
MPPRQRCRQSPTAFSCSRPSSPWPTSGWPPWSVGPLPGSSKLLAIGNDHAGQLLVTAGQHPERLRDEAAFAHLCGVAPIPASSGKTRRHRLHRGGHRDANKALHLAVVVRMRFCPRTRAYVERRTTEGLSKPEIMRCIKRYLAREIYHALVADFQALHAP